MIFELVVVVVCLVDCVLVGLLVRVLRGWSGSCVLDELFGCL